MDKINLMCLVDFRGLIGFVVWMRVCDFYLALVVRKTHTVSQLRIIPLFSPDLKLSDNIGHPMARRQIWVSVVEIQRGHHWHCKGQKHTDVNGFQNNGISHVDYAKSLR